MMMIEARVMNSLLPWTLCMSILAHWRNMAIHDVSAVWKIKAHPFGALHTAQTLIIIYKLSYSPS